VSVAAYVGVTLLESPYDVPSVTPATVIDGGVTS
jgi:hypothetical protein